MPIQARANSPHRAPHQLALPVRQCATDTRKYNFLLRGVQQLAVQTVFANPSQNLNGATALIVIYDTALTTPVMQRIATQSQHPATVFLKRSQLNKPHCPIRWFNSQCEIMRCGHGTLAAAKYLLQNYNYCPRLFITNSHEHFVMKVKRKVAQLELAAIKSKRITACASLQEVLPVTISDYYSAGAKNSYSIALINQAIALHSLEVDIKALKQSHNNALIVLQINTQDKQQCTACFRYFAPQFGVDEDSATGSAVAVIAPLIYQLYGLTMGSLMQQSPRGAFMHYKLDKHRVLIY